MNSMALRTQNTIAWVDLALRAANPRLIEGDEPKNAMETWEGRRESRNNCASDIFKSTSIRSVPRSFPFGKGPGS